jgi:hypothetical protein
MRGSLNRQKAANSAKKTRSTWNTRSPAFTATSPPEVGLFAGLVDEFEDAMEVCITTGEDRVTSAVGNKRVGESEDMMVREKWYVDLNGR